jgi:hypothetical protein
LEPGGVEVRVESIGEEEVLEEEQVWQFSGVPGSQERNDGIVEEVHVETRDGDEAHEVRELVVSDFGTDPDDQLSNQHGKNDGEPRS